MATMDNLKEAFAGESQANRKYLAFAKKAEQDGRGQIAKLFRAAAAAETVHAHAHLRVMKGIKSTAENVQAAVDGEGHEFRQMYPGFVREAKEEGNQPAVMTFENAMAVEEIHHGMYSEAAASLARGEDLPEARTFVCDICGNTVLDGAPDKCPICGAPRQRFQEIA